MYGTWLDDILYYRLQQVDPDDHAVYSAVVAIALQKGDLGPMVKAFSNPFRGKINLQIISVLASDRTDQVALFPVNGTRLYRRSLADRKNEEVIPLEDLPSLPAGVYLLRVYLNKQLYIIRMLRE